MRHAFFVAAIGLVSAPTAQTFDSFAGSPMPLPAYSNSPAMPRTYGFWFQAPVDIRIQCLAVPNEGALSHQVVEVIDFGTTPPPIWPATATGTSLFYSNDTIAGSLILTAIPVPAGRCIGILGACTAGAGGTLARTSFGLSTGPFLSNVLGIPTGITLFGTNTAIASSGGNAPCWQDPYALNPLGRVEVHVVQARVGTIATNTTLGDGCVRSNASMYEYFEMATMFDLANSALTFVPDGSGGYTAARLGSFLPVGATATPTPLVLADDDEVTRTFTVGSFPGWTAMTISSNGFVSKAPGNGVYGQIPVTMLNVPQTAFWSSHDYNPTSPGSGAVVYEESASRIVVTWDGVHDYLYPGASHLQFQFDPSGAVTIAWGAMSAFGWGYLVGYSPGGPNHDPGGTDISALGAGTVALGATDLLPPMLLTNVRPRLGTSWILVVDHVPASAVLGIDILGFTDPGLTDLSALGMPGCGLRSSLDVVLAWPPAAAHFRNVPIPNSAGLLGTDLFATAAVFQVPPVNPFGAITANGLKGHIGNL